MYNHYVINMEPNISEYSIKFGVIAQNLKWVQPHHSSRIEYLGQFIDNVGNVWNSVLVTELFGQFREPKDFQRDLRDFVELLDYSEEYQSPFTSFYQVTTVDVQKYYKELNNSIDGTWFSGWGDLSKEDYEHIKKIYYDYHLESLLYSGLREEYIKHTVSPVRTFSLSQRKSIKEIESKIAMLGASSKYLPKHIRGNRIIYGKYHVSLDLTDVTILPYSSNASDKRDPNETSVIQTCILDYAFDGCRQLESVNIMDNIYFFGSFVFRGCSNLKEVNLNSNMIEIPDNTFLDCTKLQRIRVPESVKVIGSHAFHDCTDLNDTNLLMNTSLEKIENGAFIGCSSLKNIMLPKTLEEIGDNAFARSGLEEIDIPSNVESIGWGAFQDCENLQNVTSLGCIREIPMLCFSGCTKLETVVIPNSVESIDDRAFEGCQALRQIVIPEGVKEIGADVFESCGSLIAIIFPQSLASMGDCYFEKTTIVKCKENSLVHKRAIDEDWNYQLI